MSENTTILIKTPWRQEWRLISLFLLLSVMSAGLLYIGIEGSTAPLGLVITGTIILAFCVPSSILIPFSRTVIVADAEGLYTRANIFVKGQQTPWSNIVKFEKSVQSVRLLTLTYLVIRLKHSERQGTAGLLASFTKALVAMDKPYVLGDIYISIMRLPSPVDELVFQLEEYRLKHDPSPR